MKHTCLSVTLGILILGVSLCPVQAASYGGGSGTIEDPYQIWTAEQMNEIGLNPDDWNKYFILMSDIDLSIYPEDSYNLIGRQVSVLEAAGLVVDEDRDILIWADSGFPRIRQTNLSKTSLDEIYISNSFAELRDVTIDPVNKKIYWIEAETYGYVKIQRANYNGTEVETVLQTGLNIPRGLTLDSINRKLYWTDIDAKTIRRSNLDGSQVETLIRTGLQYPEGIALDIQNDKMYWADYGNDSIRRSNLNGSSVETIIQTGLISPRDVATDPSNHKIYWCDSDTRKIQRANTDGTDIEDIITFDQGMPTSIALNHSQGRLYWINYSENKIQSSNLDGSNIITHFPLPPFKGHFNGNNHRILNFLYRKDSADLAGLFGVIAYPGQVINLIIESPNVQLNLGRYVGVIAAAMDYSAVIDGCTVNNASVTGNTYVGGVVGYSSGSIHNTQASGEIHGLDSVGGIVGCSYGNSYIFDEIKGCSFNGTVDGNLRTGGLVGSNSYESDIIDSSVGATVSGNNMTGGLTGVNSGHISGSHTRCTVNGNLYSGGLVGSNSGNISNSYSMSTIIGGKYTGGLAGSTSLEIRIEACFSSGSVLGSSFVGGLIGQSESMINDCYSNCGVQGTDSVGGLIGTNNLYVRNSYSTGRVSGMTNTGGLIGYSYTPSNINSCYWDINTSEQFSSPGGGTGKTSEDMKMSSTYIGWSCTNVEWTIDEGVDYPHFLWEGSSSNLLSRYQYGGGSGSVDDPYQIFTAEQFNMIGTLTCDWDKCFLLMANIDLSVIDDNERRDIGEYDEYSQLGRVAFRGQFNGNGHTISNYRYHRTTIDTGVGLFKYAEGGVIKDLGLVDVDIYVGDELSGQLTGRYVGGLVGIGGKIIRCFVTGSISADTYVGGIGGSTELEDCYSDVHITANSYAGGLAGVGGLKNCYATGPITATSYVGGLCGFTYTTIRSCLWNVDTTGQAKANGDKYYLASVEAWGKTSQELLLQQTYIDAGFDFDGLQMDGPNNTWLMPSGEGNAILFWQVNPSDWPALPEFSGGNGDPNDI